MKMRTLTVLALLLIPCFHAMAGNSHADRRHEFVYGVKFSASSTATNPSRLSTGSTQLNEFRIDSQVGTSLTLQGGFDFGKTALMTGIGFDYSRSTIYVDFNSWEGSELSPKEGCLSVDMKDLMVPLRLEYTCIDQAPYKMSVFAGPKFRIIPEGNFSSSFSKFPKENLEEKPVDCLACGTVGVGVKTGRTFFEFEIESSFSNISKGIYDSTGNATDITIDRRLTIMSFSIGILL